MAKEGQAPASADLEEEEEAPPKRYACMYIDTHTHTHTHTHTKAINVCPQASPRRTGNGG
jgi:hypothetical protein